MSYLASSSLTFLSYPGFTYFYNKTINNEINIILKQIKIFLSSFFSKYFSPANNVV